MPVVNSVTGTVEKEYKILRIIIDIEPQDKVTILLAERMKIDGVQVSENVRKIPLDNTRTAELMSALPRDVDNQEIANGMPFRENAATIIYEKLQTWGEIGV